ncbi:MAG: hypothetical protein JXB07_13330 [Anaerolineae bacterium]|nr:hypothetical protein [Anaerolineae bacterium]
MKTNRDLYKSIEELIQEKSEQPPLSLESYLSNLLRRAGQMADREALSIEEFFALLRDSFESSDEIPDTVMVENGVPKFYEWQAAVISQIQDLREMAENKQLADPNRYFGIDAPSGCRWYNFDPCSYVECGLLAVGKMAMIQEECM